MRGNVAGGGITTAPLEQSIPGNGMGREAKVLDYMWVVCTKCGAGHSFEDLVTLDGTPDRKESLEIWRARAEQTEVEFQRWREARKRIK